MVPRIQLSVAIANGFDVIFLHLEPVGPWHFARVLWILIQSQPICRCEAIKYPLTKRLKNPRLQGLIFSTRPRASGTTRVGACPHHELILCAETFWCAERERRV